MYNQNSHNPLLFSRALSQGALGIKRPVQQIQTENGLPKIRSDSIDIRKLDLIEPDFHLKRSLMKTARFSKNTEAHEI